MARDTQGLYGFGELAEVLGMEQRRVRWLLERAHARPAIAGTVGRNRGHLWPADYVYLVRALDRLADMHCPQVWLTSVAEFWRTVEPAAVAGGRYLVVSPSRERAPVFITSRRQLGDILAGCHAWSVDLTDRQTYR